MTGKKNVRGRISNAVSLLRTAEIVKPVEDAIEIINRERLDMVMDNLAILQDAEGIAMGLWAQRPQVPAHLEEISLSLEAQRVDTVASSQA